MTPPEDRGTWSQNFQRAATGVLLTQLIAIMYGAFTLRDMIIETDKEVRRINLQEIPGIKIGLDRVEQRARDEQRIAKEELKTEIEKARLVEIDVRELNDSVQRTEEWKMLMAPLTQEWIKTGAIK